MRVITELDLLPSQTKKFQEGHDTTRTSFGMTFDVRGLHKPHELTGNDSLGLAFRMTGAIERNVDNVASKKRSINLILQLILIKKFDLKEISVM